MSVYEGHGDIIYPGAIDGRIEELARLLPDDGQYIGPDDFFDEDEREEYAALIQFRQDVKDTCGDAAWDDSPGFIAESYFARYADDHAADLYGQEVVDLPYWNQEAYEDDERSSMLELDFDGVTYLVNNGRS